jgi:hypothetical protein
MNSNKFKIFTGLFAAVFFSCNTPQKEVIPVAAMENTKTIDPYSYNLGIIGGFSELVDVGVKKLAFSEALPPDEMDKLIAEAEKIAERNHVKLYREKDLIVTYLFPADVAVGKDVLLIYNGNTKDEYLSLKEEIKVLEKEGKYTEEAKMHISMRLGQMLSYPQAKVEEMIAKNKK